MFAIRIESTRDAAYLVFKDDGSFSEFASRDTAKLFEDYPGVTVATIFIGVTQAEFETLRDAAPE